MVTIRGRLLALVAVALIPAVAIVAYDEYLFRQQVFSALQQDAVRLVSLVDRQIESEIAETGRRCGLLDRIPAVQTLDASAGAFLAEHLRESPQYTNLAIADAGGRIVASALPFRGEVSVRERVFFRRTVETKAFAVGVFYRNPITPRPGINLGCPLLGPDGTVRGVIWASLGLEWIADFVAGGGLPRDAVVLVVDKDGTVLMRSLDPGRWVGQKIDRSEVFQIMRRGSSGNGCGPWSGRGRSALRVRPDSGGRAGCRRIPVDRHPDRDRASVSRGRRSSATWASSCSERWRASALPWLPPSASFCARRGRCSARRAG